MGEEEEEDRGDPVFFPGVELELLEGREGLELEEEEDDLEHQMHRFRVVHRLRRR